MSSPPLIVVPAFRRPDALRRLLTSIKRASLPDCPGIIISIEGEAAAETIKVAEEFNCGAINVKVIVRPVRLGLKEHIIACTSLSSIYGSVIVLEEDLVVDRYFYNFASEALKHYAASGSIAAVSLYSPRVNEYAGLPFEAIRNEYSNYFSQVPCSWGQAWTAEQWTAFLEWLRATSEADLKNIVDLPEAIKRWPETSWKKYFAGYLVSRRKYIVYPYSSYTTNCSDPAGENIKLGTSEFQVPIGNGQRKSPSFSFVPTQELNTCCYDCHFEASHNWIFSQLDIKPDEIEIDLYGLKSLTLLKQKKYSLTRKKAKNVIREFPLFFHPVEINIQLVEVTSFKSKAYLVNSTDLIESTYQASISDFEYFTRINFSTKRFLKLFTSHYLIWALKKIASIQSR